MAFDTLILQKLATFLDSHVWNTIINIEHTYDTYHQKYHSFSLQTQKYKNHFATSSKLASINKVYLQDPTNFLEYKITFI